MPIYEYRCKRCQHKFDRLVPMGTEDSEIECPACHEKQAERALSLFGTSGSGSRSRSASSCAPTGG